MINNKIQNCSFDGRITDIEGFRSDRCIQVMVNNDVHGYIDENGNAVIVDLTKPTLFIDREERRDIYEAIISTLPNEVKFIPFKYYLPTYKFWSAITLLCNISDSIFGETKIGQGPNGDWIKYFKRSPLVSRLFQFNGEENNDENLIELGQDLIIIFEFIRIINSNKEYDHLRSYIRELKQTK